MDELSPFCVSTLDQALLGVSDDGYPETADTVMRPVGREENDERDPVAQERA
jgi:hypothetical protein